MIEFGTLSISLLICAVQGIILALLLMVAKNNKKANFWLAVLIFAFCLHLTPYIIGYAGYYDAYPWLSFAPFSNTMIFGPLIFLYCTGLIGDAPKKIWPHFMFPIIQFLSEALVFPLPLAVKNHWDTIAHAKYIAPFFDWAALVSLIYYGSGALLAYAKYKKWLDENRTDGANFEPYWIRNFLFAVGATFVVWLGFTIANTMDPSRNYFDQFWLYFFFALLVIYHGVEGWRHAEVIFPQPNLEPSVPIDDDKNWGEIANAWRQTIEKQELWRDSNLTLSSLARHLGTNTSYLSRAINLGFGLNFNQFINSQRIDFIKTQIENGSKTDFLNLAFDAGFNSKASFNRAFFELVGMSPSAFKRLKS